MISSAFIRKLFQNFPLINEAVNIPIKNLKKSPERRGFFSPAQGENKGIFMNLSIKEICTDKSHNEGIIEKSNSVFYNMLPALLLLLTGCQETFFVDIKVIEKANQILPALEKLIQLKIKQNDLITKRNEFIDESNQLIIKLNEKLDRQSPLLLQAYQLKEEGKDPSRYLDESNQIKNEADRLRSEVNQIREDAEDFREQINRLIGEIHQVRGQVNQAIEEANQLKEEFPKNFTESLQLVNRANDLLQSAQQAMIRHNDFVADHNQLMSKIDQLDKEVSGIYRRANSLSTLRDNFNEQERYRRRQENIINNLKRARSDEIDFRVKEVDILKEALQLLKTVSQSTPVENS